MVLYITLGQERMENKKKTIFLELGKWSSRFHRFLNKAEPKTKAFCIFE